MRWVPFSCEEQSFLVGYISWLKLIIFHKFILLESIIFFYSQRKENEALVMPSKQQVPETTRAVAMMRCILFEENNTYFRNLSPSKPQQTTKYCQRCCTHSTSWRICHVSVVGYIKAACKGVSLMVWCSYLVSQRVCIRIVLVLGTDRQNICL
jgi:hypothetical protein